MSDEGIQPDSGIDSFEAVNTMVNMATLVWAFHTGLLEQGFTLDQAFKLTLRYVHGMAGGKIVEG